MIRVAIAGLGKMGMSHHAMINTHPDAKVVGICDASNYVLGVLKKYTGVSTYTDFDAMLNDVKPDAVVIATPSNTHAHMVATALEHDVHVFCEKPFTLDVDDAERLTSIGRARGLVTQVGYHNRFVGAFREARSLLDAGAIGEVTHVLGEAYGPVVLKPKGGTWRSRRSAGGGCLYDYAAHVIDLMNWYVGEPTGVGGTTLTKIFSREIDDQVSSTMRYHDQTTAQISVNWSDESCRKMTTRVTIWGTEGRIYADRQECQVYLRGTANAPAGYEQGWNVRFTTELTDPVWFYLRGEEYSAQLDHFLKRIALQDPSGLNDFESAAMTDRVIAMMIADAERSLAADDTNVPLTTVDGSRKPRWWRR